ncbi:MAG: GNAT family N-acetyltransferase, partial [Alphaproteobacteria bacterium]
MSAASQMEYAHELPRWVQDAQVSIPPAYNEDLPPAPSGDFLCKVDDLECRVFSNLSEVAIHWRNLEQSAWLTPFQQYFWSTSASSSCGDDRTITPQIVVGFQSGIPKLLLPFAIETRWFTRRLVWLGQRFNDYNTPIIDRRSLTLTAEAYARIVESVAAARAVDAMHLIRKPVDDSMPSYGEALDAEYASHVVDLSRDWNATYRQLRSSRSRQRIRSKMKALRQGGRVSFRKLRNPVEKSREAHQILEWKSEQLDSLGKTNPFRVRESGLSRAIFVAIGDMNGNLEVYGLFHDDVMVAG